MCSCVLAAALYTLMILFMLNRPAGTSGFTCTSLPTRLLICFAAMASSSSMHILASFSSGMAHVYANMS
jgi:hypothetical protein